MLMADDSRGPEIDRVGAAGGLEAVEDQPYRHGAFADGGGSARSRGCRQPAWRGMLERQVRPGRTMPPRHTHSKEPDPRGIQAVSAARRNAADSR